MIPNEKNETSDRANHDSVLNTQILICNIVRLEFPPVVEIGVNRGHYFPQETTNEGPILTNAMACYNLFCFCIVSSIHSVLLYSR